MVITWNPEIERGTISQQIYGKEFLLRKKMSDIFFSYQSRNHRVGLKFVAEAKKLNRQHVRESAHIFLLTTRRVISVVRLFSWLFWSRFQIMNPKNDSS
jgi:hypothetical protein